MAQTLWERLGLSATEPDEFKNWVIANSDNPSIVSKEGGWINGKSTMTMPVGVEDLRSQWTNSMSLDDISAFLEKSVAEKNNLIVRDDLIAPAMNDKNEDVSAIINNDLVSQDSNGNITYTSQADNKLNKLANKIKTNPEGSINPNELDWGNVKQQLESGTGIPELKLPDDPSRSAIQKILDTPAKVKADREETKKGKGFLGGIFGEMTEEKRAMLIMWLNSMRLEPDPGITSAMNERLKLIRAGNNTSGVISSLIQMGRKDLANMVSNKTMTAKDAIDMAYKDKDLKTKSLTELRKEFQNLSSVKDVSMQVSAFGRIIASAQDPSPAGDLAMIFNYMKILDPGSTVREGEFANAQNSGGIDDKTIALYNSVVTGTRLSQPQRDDFLGRAAMLYEEAERALLKTREWYVNKAGVPDEEFAAPVRYTGEYTKEGETLKDIIQRILDERKKAEAEGKKL